MKLYRDDIKKLDRFYRINLINSITGVKPANLVGTKNDISENLAIFSSLVHLGSYPPLLGLIVRPQNKKNTDTFLNIKKSRYYTINSISSDIYKKAHLTSAKTNKSEFKSFNIESQYIDSFYAPFVMKSAIKIGLKLESILMLPNKCEFIIGSINLININESLINSEGKVNFQKEDILGISGIDGYYKLEHLNSLPYVGSNYKGIKTKEDL